VCICLQTDLCVATITGVTKRATSRRAAVVTTPGIGSGATGTGQAESPGEELGPLAVSLVEAARSLTRTAARAAGPGVARTLAMAQLDLLLEIRRHPGLTVTDLAERLQLARNTVSTLVGQLTRARLVVRSDDARDARVTRLSLTDAAAERMAGWRSRRAAAVHDGLAALSPRDLTAIRRAVPSLRALVRAVELAQSANTHDVNDIL
jgi:DNA-binding MarR family transcriptional regulator